MTEWQSITGLNEGQRQDARAAARATTLRALGDAPQPEQFEKAVIGVYPPKFNLLVTIGVLLVLGAAGYVSATRVIRAAFEESAAAGYPQLVSGMSAIGVFLMAEIALAVVLLAARVLEVDGRVRWFFYLVAVIAAGFAVVGNAVIVAPTFAATWMGAWSLLLTFAPPVFVIAVVLVLEPLILAVIRRRHEAHVAYEKALATYRAERADPEALAGFQHHYRAALKSALWESNKHRVGVAGLTKLTGADWRRLVARELMAEQALDDLSAEMAQLNAPNEEARPETHPTMVPARSMQLLNLHGSNSRKP